MYSHVERTKILQAFKTSKDVNTIFLSKVRVPYFYFVGYLFYYYSICQIIYWFVILIHEYKHLNGYMLFVGLHSILQYEELYVILLSAMLLPLVPVDIIKIV